MTPIRVARAAPSNKRLGLLVLAIALAVGVAGCGRGSGAQSASSNSPSFTQGFKSGFDKSFNQAFARTSHDSCVSAAVSRGGAPDKVERYCTCVVAQIMPLSVEEKQHLTASSDKLTQASAACRDQLQ